ncbi:hypothetical protein [Rhizobium rhizogenes]
MRNKLSRGKFTSSFMRECLSVTGSDAIRID